MLIHIVSPSYEYVTTRAAHDIGAGCGVDVELLASGAYGDPRDTQLEAAVCAALDAGKDYCVTCAAGSIVFCADLNADADSVLDAYLHHR